MAEQQRAEIAQSIIGYAKLDILHFRDRLEFRNWNLRPINKKEVDRLALSFELEGIDRFHQEHAIPLVVQPGDLAAGSFIPASAFDGFSSEKLPVVQFISETSNIAAAGGQHCLCALDKRMDQLQKEIDALETIVTRDNSYNRITNPEEQQAAIKQWNKHANRLNSVKDQYALGGLWLVTLYDFGLLFVIIQCTFLLI